MTLAMDIVEMENLVLVDNGVGVMTHGVGHSADKHEYVEDMHVTLKDSVIVANSDLFDCETDTYPFTYEFLPHKKRKWTERFRAKGGNFHHTGVVMPIFQSKFPKATLPWNKPIISAEGSNPALRGIMYMTNVTFDRFNNRCNGQKDIAIRTNPGEDDMNFPIQTKKITMLDVAEDSKVFFNRPLAGKINPADCTDFDCDGMKKAIIWDLDGSFMGQVGSIIPDSAFEWDGSPKRGLGYYRVPKPMVTELNGDRISFASKMPNTGVFRGDSNCDWVDGWTAYKCRNINHRLMIIESMDRDTKIRRLSPIAVLTDPGASGYIDLVNGPQDFSCCSGYTCAERLSTFYTMVATGQEVEVVMSSIPPQNFKFHLLHNGDSGDAVRVKFWFPKQQRYDIYTEGRYIPPMNKDFSDSKGHTLFPSDDKYIPSLTDNNCNNYFDPITGYLYLIVRGPATCDIKTQPVVILKLGITVPDAEFFNPESIVENIAGLLGIDKANIRVTNIVREGGGGRRRKRESESIELQFEIAPAPSENLGQDFVPEEVTYTTPANPNDATLKPSYITSTTTTLRPVPVIDTNKMNFEDLSQAQAKFATAFQSGALNIALNATVNEMKMEDPIPPPEEPPAYTSPEERGEVLEITFAASVAAENIARLSAISEEKTFDVPTNLVIGRQPYDAEEMTPLTFFPFLFTTNANSETLTNIGNVADPWKVTATLVTDTGPTGATLNGTLDAPIIDGYANFTNLLFSHEGEGYIVSFAITFPSGLTIPNVQSIPVSVGPRPLGIIFAPIDELLPNSDVFNATFNIWDIGLDQPADSQVLGSYTWQCTLTFSRNVPVTMVGDTINDITEAGSNFGQFSLRFEGYALDIQLKVTCESTSADEDARTLVGTSGIFTLFPGSASSVGLLRKTNIGMKFSGPYTVIKPVIDSFDAELGTLSCEGPGCPQSNRKKRSVSFSDQYLDLTTFNEQMCNMPFCIMQDQSCIC